MWTRSSKAIRRIQNVGYLQGLAESSPQEARLIVHQSGPGQSCCFDLGGGAIILVYLRLACSQPVRISEFGALRLFDTRLSVDWWANEPDVNYRVERDFELPYEQVLNHQVEEGVIVRPSYPIEGWVIGRIFEGFPSGLLRGVRLEPVLEIYDDLGELYLEEIQLLLEPRPLRKTGRRSTLDDEAGGKAANPTQPTARPGPPKWTS